jgi:hypothetical protein
MSKGKEALDAVSKDKERPFLGVHLLATAMLCAAGSSSDELELARRILERDPKHDAPREAESIAAAFNRQMDAAIESCNASAHSPTRAVRRAQLAADLDLAGLVLIDRNELAGLLADRINLTHTLEGSYAIASSSVSGEDFGAELLATAERGSAGILGMEFASVEGVTFLTHNPSFDISPCSTATGSDAGLIIAGVGNPNVND